MKILTIALVALMISNVCIVSGDFIQKKSIIKTLDEEDFIEIKVAIFTDAKEDEDFYGPQGRTRYFVYAMRNYSWKVGNATYRFKTDLLSTKELHQGKLNKDNFDVFVYDPEISHYKCFTSPTRFKLENLIDKRMITKFVEDGGGVFGTCGGSIILGGFEGKPDTYLERGTKNAMLHISAFNTEVNNGLPLLCELAGFNEDRIGASGAYYWYGGWNASDYDINYHTLVCLDAPIDLNSPIFDDNVKDTRRIRWVGGDPLVIPENPDRKINVIATFPEEEMSENESTQIHYWTYNSGIIGLIKGMLNKKENYWYAEYNALLNMYCFASDWEKTDKIVETKFSNRPFFTTEIYPNENKARIARCTGHPEFNVWWGGHIEDVEDTDYNNQYEAFYKWKDIIPENETEEDEFTYNYCIVRRSVAWASQKVPDNDLPSIYGESQVSDFEENLTSSEFTVYGNSETAEGNITLDLYYRYSHNNTDWSEWSLFNADVNETNGWSWEFNSPNGTGYYQFYSIRNVEYEGYTETEKVPPGADSTVFVE